MTRLETLEAAKTAVCGDRDQKYGAPEDNFGRIAEFWSTYRGIKFTPGDVAAMLSLMKIARMVKSPDHADNWIDLAGYAACGSEVTAKK